MHVYLIPGLGYDHRIFERLDLTKFQAQALDWIEPAPQENIRHYAQRMAERIPAAAQNITLIGHSFGGIMAQEIAALRSVEKIILIGSIKSRKELPFFFKIVAPLKLHKLFTKERCIRSVSYWGKSHDFIHAEDQELFKSMVGRHSNHYLQWALYQLSIWQKPRLPEPPQIFHIHGDRDKTLPFRLIEKPYFQIPKGSHIISYQRAEEVSALLQQLLSKPISAA